MSRARVNPKSMVWFGTVVAFVVVGAAVGGAWAHMQAQGGPGEPSMVHRLFAGETGAVSGLWLVIGALAGAGVALALLGFGEAILRTTVVGSRVCSRAREARRELEETLNDALRQREGQNAPWRRGSIRPWPSIRPPDEVNYPMILGLVLFIAAVLLLFPAVGRVISGNASEKLQEEILDHVRGVLQLLLADAAQGNFWQEAADRSYDGRDRWARLVVR